MATTLMLTVLRLAAKHAGSRVCGAWEGGDYMRGEGLLFVVIVVCCVAQGCSGAAPLYPARSSDAALVAVGGWGHFLPPQQAARGRRSTRKSRRSVSRPAGPARRAAPSSPLRRRVGTRKKLDFAGQQRVTVAASLLGTAGLGRRAFVDHVLHAVGSPIVVSSARPYAGQLWRKLARRRVKTPRPGDLVFFNNTLDLNRNSKPDDGITWVAVVQRVDTDRVIFIGQRAGKVRRMSLSTRRRRLVRDSAGRVRNTRLVRWPGEAEPRTAGQCFAGYARP